MSKKAALLFISMLLGILSIGCTKGYRKVSGQPPSPERSNITGTVVMASDGSPAADAEIMLCRDAIMVTGCRGQIGATRTDASGVYTFQNVPPGEYVPAVVLSASSIFLMQEKKQGEYIPRAITYRVGPDETIEIAPIVLEQIPEPPPESPLKLVYPIGSSSARDRKPTLKWEMTREAEYCAVALSRVDVEPSIDIQITEHPFEPVNANSLTVPNDLPEGVYKWIVQCTTKGALLPRYVRAEAYFSVAGESVKKNE